MGAGAGSGLAGGVETGRAQPPERAVEQAGQQHGWPPAVLHGRIGQGAQAQNVARQSRLLQASVLQDGAQEVVERSAWNAKRIRAWYTSLAKSVGYHEKSSWIKGRLKRGFDLGRFKWVEKISDGMNLPKDFSLHCHSCRYGGSGPF